MADLNIVEQVLADPLNFDLLDRLPAKDIPSVKAIIKTRAAKASGGLSTIIAEGDSWFDYWIWMDVLDCISNRFGWQISKQYALHGDTLENMLLGTKSDRNGDLLPPGIDHALAELKEVGARVLLLSGGGNDIAGDELFNYLNHKDSGSSDLLRVDELDRMVNKSMFKWIESAIEKLDRMNAQHGLRAKIFMHGYGWALPTGKGIGPGNILPGPWLQPSLWRKGIKNFDEGALLVKRLINIYNEMLERVKVTHPLLFEYIDVRDEIHSTDWSNELHLTAKGFGKVAKKIGDAVQIHLNS